MHVEALTIRHIEDLPSEAKKTTIPDWNQFVQARIHIEVTVANKPVTLPGLSRIRIAEVHSIHRRHIERLWTSMGIEMFPHFDRAGLNHRTFNLPIRRPTISVNQVERQTA